MTRRANSAIAGSAFLLYIALAYPAILLFTKASAGDGISAKLANIAEHSADVRLSAVLFLLGSFCALILAVTLYRITCEEDADLATFAMICRVAEGVAGSGLVPSLGLTWLAGSEVTDRGAANTIAGLLWKVQDWDMLIASMFFAVGSTVFAYLFLRGRIIPVPLAWLGLIASALLSIGLPLQLTGVVSAAVIQIIFIPLALFEIPLGFWLLIKGARAPEKLRVAETP